MTQKKQATTPRDCRKCSGWQGIKNKVRIVESLTATIEEIEKRMKKPDFKPTLGEYIKLVQMEQELEQEEAKEIKVTWVEPAISGSEK